MSRIDELIQRLCPDGVEYKPLGEVGKFLRGSSFQKKHFADEGTSCIHYGQLYTHYGLSAHATLSFLDPEFAKGKKGAKPGDLVIATTSENVEDVGKACAWLGESDIVVSNDAFVFRHNMDPMYASYLFASALFQEQKMRFITGAKVHRISGDSMAKIVLPVPPLEVQREIVRILDAFTELEANLQRELDARKRQYEYYRDELLSFGNEIEHKPIAEVFNTRNGYTPSKKNPEYWEAGGTVPWFRMEDIRENGRLLETPLQYVSESAVKRNGLVPKGSIIVATSATIGEHAMLMVDGLCNQRFTCLTAKQEYSGLVSEKYVFYWCDVLDGFCKMNLNQGNFASVNMDAFNKCPFPIPPLEMQQEIVDKLDAMVALQDNLQHQIDLTHKQYEHYRDALLDLPRKGA